jgi:hypothetical protein
MKVLTVMKVTFIDVSEEPAVAIFRREEIP